MYVVMFVQFMRKARDLNGFKRFFMPALALCGCFFMVYAAIAGYGIKVFYYLIVYAIFMVVGNCFYRKRA